MNNGNDFSFLKLRDEMIKLGVNPNVNLVKEEHKKLKFEPNLNVVRHPCRLINFKLIYLIFQYSSSRKGKSD